jgi:hypothetical protein
VIPVIQGGSNMTGTNCDLFTHKQSRSYLNHLVITATGTILKTFRKYLSNVPGIHEVKELQKTAILYAP